jgi:hypothetical protein
LYCIESKTKKAVENCQQSRKKSSKKPTQKIVNKAIKSRKIFLSKKPPQKVVNKKDVKFFFEEGLGMCGRVWAQSTEHRA